MEFLRKKGFLRTRTVEAPTPQISYEYALNRLAEHINPDEPLPTTLTSYLTEVVDLFRPLMDNPHIEDPWKIIDMLDPGAINYGFDRRANTVQFWLPAAVQSSHPAFDAGMHVNCESSIVAHTEEDQKFINPRLTIELSTPTPAGEEKRPITYLLFNMFRKNGRQRVTFVRNHTDESGKHDLQATGFEETAAGWQQISP